MNVEYGKPAIFVKSGIPERHTRAMAVLSGHSRINLYVVPAVTSATEAVSV